MTTIFWNVDTQYDFMRNDESFKGTLPVPGARAIEANLEDLTLYAKKNTVLVVNTADWHTAESKEISAAPDYKTTFPPHCLIGTKGAEFVPATRPRQFYAIDWRAKQLNERALSFIVNRDWEADLVIYKDDFDVFKGNPHTEKVLSYINPDRAVVYGVATNVCVHYAVTGLLERGVDVIVVQDAIKELPNLPPDTLLAEWSAKGAAFATTSEIISNKFRLI